MSHVHCPTCGEALDLLRSVRHFELMACDRCGILLRRPDGTVDIIDDAVAQSA